MSPHQVMAYLKTVMSQQIRRCRFNRFPYLTIDEIIEAEVDKFNNWVVSLDAVPTIVEIRKQAESAALSEADKTLSRMPHLTEGDRVAIHNMTQSIINKILHKPTVNLKKKPQSNEGHAYLKAIRELFHLDD